MAKEARHDWPEATREGVTALAEALKHLQAAEVLLKPLAIPYPLTTSLKNARGKIMANLGSIPRPLWKEIGDAW